MQMSAESGATPTGLPAATFVAAAAAACASLLHWIGTTTDTHAWSIDAAVSLLAGAGLMALAITLAGRPLSIRMVRRVCLIGAVGTAVVVIAFLLPVLSEVTSGHAEQAEHAGHALAGGEALIAAEVVRTTLELVLIGLLVWIHRATGPGASALTETSD